MNSITSVHSLTSIYLDLYFNDNKLGTGTGFIVQHGEDYFLVTNYHVLSGYDFFSGKPLDIINSSIPNKVCIRHHKKDQLGYYNPVVENLGNNFIGGPDMGMDLVILKLTHISNNINIYPVKYIDEREIKDQPMIYPGQMILIAGFPYGVTQFSKLPIWKSGCIASEYDVPFQERDNCFLVDAATRGGMSGSPVFAYFNGTYRTYGGLDQITMGSLQYKFLGTYSGRRKFPTQEVAKRLNEAEVKQINEIGSDIGMVWKSECIDILLSKFKD